MKVSWQVTGIRKDPYAEAYRIPVEEQKTEKERGTYLYPKEHGVPEERGVDYQQRRAAQAALNAPARPELSSIPVAPASARARPPMPLRSSLRRVGRGWRRSLAHTGSDRGMFAVGRSTGAVAP